MDTIAGKCIAVSSPVLSDPISAFPNGPVGPGLELREYFAAVKVLKMVVRDLVFQTSPSPDELNEVVLTYQLCD